MMALDGEAGAASSTSIHNSEETARVDDSSSPTKPTSAHSFLRRFSPYLRDRGRAKHAHETLDPSERLLPIIQLPLPNDEHEWLPEDKRQDVWLGLFYDLVLVAVLTIFSSIEELTTPARIGTYISYVSIIWVVWLTQILYDVKFAARDRMHGLLKLFQLIIIIYLGAAANGWNPVDTYFEPDDVSEAASSAQLAARSFLAVSIAYAVSRFLMCTQFLVLIMLAKKVKRPSRSFWWPIFCCLLSGIFAIIAAVLKSSSPHMAIVRTVLFYIGLIIEGSSAMPILLFVQARSNMKNRKWLFRTSAELLSERMGGLTLIILGEGMISILRTFAAALTSFNTNSAATYTQVISSIIVLHFLFTFLFSGFSAKHWLGARRLMTWTALHLPLHFCILLMIASMSNTIRVTSFGYGAGNVATQTSTIALAIIEDNTTYLQHYDPYTFARQLGALDLLYPPWETEQKILNQTRQEQGIPAAIISLLQYESKIYVDAAILYGVEIEDSAFELFLRQQEQPLPQANATNETITEALNEAEQLNVELLSEILTAGYSGTLWMYPAAGASLVFSALLFLVRHDHVGNSFRFVELLHMSVGLALALLGLLDIGNKNVNVQLVQTATGGYTAKSGPTNKMYNLVSDGFALGVVAIVYSGLWMIDSSLLIWARKRQGRSSIGSPINEKHSSLVARRSLPLEDKANLASSSV